MESVHEKKPSITEHIESWDAQRCAMCDAPVDCLIQPSEEMDGFLGFPSSPVAPLCRKHVLAIAKPENVARMEAFYFQCDTVIQTAGLRSNLAWRVLGIQPEAHPTIHVGIFLGAPASKRPTDPRPFLIGYWLFGFIPDSKVDCLHPARLTEYPVPFVRDDPDRPRFVFPLMLRQDVMFPAKYPELRLSRATKLHAITLPPAIVTLGAENYKPTAVGAFTTVALEMFSENDRNPGGCPPLTASAYDERLISRARHIMKTHRGGTVTQKCFRSAQDLPVLPATTLKDWLRGSSFDGWSDFQRKHLTHRPSRTDNRQRG